MGALRNFQIQRGKWRRARKGPCKQSVQTKLTIQQVGKSNSRTKEKTNKANSGGEIMPPKIETREQPGRDFPEEKGGDVIHK